MATSREAHQRSVAKWMAKQAARGKCVRCRRDAAPGRKQCEAHLEIDRRRLQKYYDARAEDRSARWKARRELGLCGTCGGPSGGKTYCWEHRILNKAWQAEYRKRKRQRKRQLGGQCLRCERPADPGHQMCRPHLDEQNDLRRRSEARHGRKRNGKRVFYQPEDTEPMCLECGASPPMTGQVLCWCCLNPPAPKREFLPPRASP